MSQEQKMYDESPAVILDIKGKTRKELRDSVIHHFLKEPCGYLDGGVKHIIKKRYNVETLTDGNKVYLLRPAHLNKGMDFQVVVEGFKKFNNGKDKPPKHDDIVEDLWQKLKEDKNKVCELLKLIERVWNCEEPDVVLKEKIPKFKTGESVELLLKTLKWLFIEQDMTYWSYTGRHMLWNEIKEKIKCS